MPTAVCVAWVRVVPVASLEERLRLSASVTLPPSARLAPEEVPVDSLQEDCSLLPSDTVRLRLAPSVQEAAVCQPRLSVSVRLVPVLPESPVPTASVREVPRACDVDRDSPCETAWPAVSVVDCETAVPWPEAVPRLLPLDSLQPTLSDREPPSVLVSVTLSEADVPAASDPCTLLDRAAANGRAMEKPMLMLPRCLDAYWLETRDMRTRASVSRRRST